MNYLKAAGVVFVLACIGFLFYSFQTSSSLQQRLEEVKKSQSATSTRSRASSPAPAAVPPKVRRIQAEDPAKYGMVVTPDDVPQTAHEWENTLTSVIEDQKIFDSAEAKEALSKIPLDEAEHQADLERLEKSIAEHEQMIKDDPENAESKEELENLYKVKAVSKILKDKIPSQPAAPPVTAEPAS